MTGLQDGKRLKASAGGVDITPAESITMAGFGNPDKRISKGVYENLYVKALVLDDGKKRAAILGADFLGWSNYLTEQVRKRLKRSCGLQPGEIFLNASHTHCGPKIWGEPSPYVESVLEKTVKLVERCFSSKKRAKIYFGNGHCDMAWNRRRLDKNGFACGGINLFGRVDHNVPVLKVIRDDGRKKGDPEKIIAIVMSYSCHPTTLGGDHYLGPDYVGYARNFVEERISGATAIFLQGCGGDSKPGRRRAGAPSLFSYAGGPPAARAIGEKLGRAVIDVVAGRTERLEMEEISGSINGQLKAVDLPLLDTVIMDGTQAAEPFQGSERRLARLAKSILQSVDSEGNYKKTWPAEIVVLRIGKDFVLAGMNGELCADIGLNTKGRLEPRPAIVCGYTSRYYEPYHGYVPSRHMIEERGYEAQIPFSPEMEDFVVCNIMKMAGKGSSPECVSHETVLERTANPIIS